MKIFNQNRISANFIRNPNARQSFLSKPVRRNQAIAGATIFVVIILHFVSQFVLFPGEKFQSELTSVQTEAEESVKFSTEDEAPNFDIAAPAVPAQPVVRSKPKIAAPPQPSPQRPVVKKKEPARETRAERLRRAERILTGV